MTDYKTHFTGDDCVGGHYFAKACPSCGSENRENGGLGEFPCTDLWHVGPDDHKESLEDA